LSRVIVAEDVNAPARLFSREVLPLMGDEHDVRHNTDIKINTDVKSFFITASPVKKLWLL
jgi:hypothetical protein